MKQIQIIKKGSVLQTKINLPASKSISNRLLIMRSLEREKLHFDNLSEAEDTYMMRLYLSFINTCTDSVIPLSLDAHNAGTVFRFLTAYLSQKDGKYLLTGFDRMKKRPIGNLVTALRNLGANIEYTEKEGFPPLLIHGVRLHGGEVQMDGSSSSQFVSALMLIAPYLPQGLQINLNGKAVSTSYVHMTAELMRAFGAEINFTDHSIAIKPGSYKVSPVRVEADWSSAAFWYQMVAFLPSSDVFLPGLTANSLQGDSFLTEVFAQLGVHTDFLKNGVLLSQKGKAVAEIDFDFSNAPDIVPSVMTTCAALGVKGHFRSIEHLRIKESDRIESMQQELAKIGVRLVPEDDAYVLIPGDKPDGPLIFESHADHRLAMCLAPLALIHDEVTVVNSDVVNKSYPDYWNDLKKSGVLSLKTFDKEEIMTKENK